MDKVFEAVTVRASIRCKENIPCKKLTKIFQQKNIEEVKEYQQYLYGFFEEVYPSLLIKYLKASSLNFNDILSIYELLPDRGEKQKFREYLQNGKFQSLAY